MKTFILLLTGADRRIDLSPVDMQILVEQWGAWIGDLAGRGHFASGILLDSEGKLVSHPGATAVSDPAVGAEEAISGCLLITADDMQTAVEIAKVCPILNVGGRVEVRAVQERTM